MNTNISGRRRGLFTTLAGVFIITGLFAVTAPAQVPDSPELSVPATPAKSAAKAIPFDQLGVEAEKQYAGDGIAIIPTADGARLRAAFQRLEGQATPEGLWLESTADEDAGKAIRFRVRAAAIGREGSPDTVRLAKSGQVRATPESAVFVRPGLIEEYAVSMDGVRQDFVVLERPLGNGELSVTLEVTGARPEATPYGAKLVLDGSGREIAYSRLHVTDANGLELPARIGLTAAGGVQVRVDDIKAAYPIRIDPTFSDADWISTGVGLSGTDESVTAIAVDTTGNLYICGPFSSVGGVSADSVAKWNGTVWSALGSGMSNSSASVSALAVSGTDLYAGGRFTTAGGVSANNIAKWNGSAWSALGSGTAGGDSHTWSNGVGALAVSGTDLYVGGTFTTAGGANAKHIAKWNGNAWSALGAGVNNNVYALAISGTDLFAGGEFNTAGGVSATSIAKWNGSAWSALGSGMGGSDEFVPWVSALAVSGSDLYAGGAFYTAGGVRATGIAKWNGIAWSALGEGVNSNVYALAVSGTDLYAGGYFTTAGGVTAKHIAKWNGSAWSSLGQGMGDTVRALVVSGTNLYAGGDFATAGGVIANCIAKWDGNVWNALAFGSGFNKRVDALLVSGIDVYAGGLFSTVSGVTANCVAKWDGNAWNSLGSGLENSNARVFALAMCGNDLYAGGWFTTAGGVSAQNIAKWNGSVWSALGAGMNSSVSALAVSGSDLYAGGLFTTAGGTSANHIAKWNGSVWSSLGAGMGGFAANVTSMLVSGPDLYAGGWFETAGGIAVSNIGKWNGRDWSALGTGVFGGVMAMAVSGTDIYAAGDILLAGGVNVHHIAKWNGRNWSALGSGITYGEANDGYVNALAVSGSDLYVGGWFNMAGGVSANNIAKWNGSAWSALGSGMGGSGLGGIGDVAALAVAGPHLFAGGSFTTAGGKTSLYLAKAAIGPPPRYAEIIVEQPSGTNLVDGADSIHFGSINVSAISPARTFVVKNIGTSDLTVSTITRVGGNTGDFVVNTAGVAITLPPGGNTTFTATFKPTAKGARGTTLRITSNDADENPFDVALAGTGIVPVPEVVIEQPAGSSLKDDTAKKSFGTVKVGKAGTAKTFIIKNTGSANLSDLSITRDGKAAKDFVITNPAKSTLAPGVSTTFKVTFKPTARETRNAAIHIKSNDADENPFDIKLTGFGAKP